MGIITTLRGSNIRFNPKPWLNQEPAVEEVEFQPVENITMVGDKTFVDLHLQVTEKVDALIASMETEGHFDNWEEPETEQTNLTPERKTDLEETVLRN